MRELIDINARVAQEADKANAAAAAATNTKVLFCICVGVLLAIAFGLLMARAIGLPLRAMQVAAEKLALGDVNVSIELHSRDELGSLAQSFRVMSEVIKERAALAQKIAAGDVTLDVKPTSEQDLLGKSFVEVVESLRRLVAEADMLAGAAIAGKLATRGNAGQFHGGYRKIVEGVNSTLDAVISPLNVAASYVDRISKGDLPPQITDTYQGEFNTIKNNLNTLIVAMDEVTHAAEEIAQGNLTVVVRERSAQDKLMQALIAMTAGLTRTVTDSSHDRRRSFVGQQGDQHCLGAGIQRRQRAGRVGRRSLLFDGRDGVQYQAKRRQRAADRQDRHQIGQGRAGERQVRAGSGVGDEGNRHQDLHH